MFLKKKKSLTEINIEDRKLIESNAKSFETLLVLSKTEEFNRELKRIQNKIMYLGASTNEKVLDFDKKIKETIDDLKISLTKDGDTENNLKATKLLKDIEILITERECVN